MFFTVTGYGCCSSEIIRHLEIKKQAQKICVNRMRLCLNALTFSNPFIKELCRLHTVSYVFRAGQNI